MLRLSLLLVLLSQSGSSVLLGWVESPGYPKGYLPHSSLNWSRCAPKGHTLSIRLIHLDLEDSQDCESDDVKVFSDRSLISRLCGKREFEELESAVNPLLVSNPGGCLSLSFHSDYSNTRRHSGFRGFYTVQDYDECEDPENGCTQFCHNWIGGYHCSCRHGYHLDADKHTCTVSCTKDLSGLTEGDISSPSWAGSYAENARCVYTLSVETHRQLELHFSGIFDVEQSPDGQCIDTLTIETHSGKLGPFCGHTPPPSPLLTHSHRVQIHFKTDGFGSNKGFSLHFQTRGKVCPAVISPYSTVTPPKPEYHEDEVVTVTCDVGYVANSEGAKIMTSDYVSTCQRTGVWSPSYICEPVDCGFLDLPEDGILIMVGSGSQYGDQIQFNCSSKYYTLDRDDTYTCGASGEWESADGSREIPKCIETCGMPEQNPSSSARIIGGSNAHLGEIPWHLLIKEPRRGGASLINDRWAVAAAHVVEGLEETSLRLYGGLVDGRTAENRLSGVQSFDSERIIIHPGYAAVAPSADRTNYDNDIALIRFSSKVNLGPNLLPICLPEGGSTLTVNEMGVVSGWGATERGFKSAILKHAQIGVYSLEKCRDTPILPPDNRMTFTDNMFCAGYEGRDSCEMDSGGPFSVSGGTGRPYHLMGIVSWGPPCSQRQFKGYYTKVANYVDWIKNTIETVGNS